jgi:uncharacterized protein (TIGR03437 family)
VRLLAAGKGPARPGLQADHGRFEERFCDQGIDVSTGTVYVSFYATGIRGFTSLANVTCTIGGVSAPVVSAGAQGQFPGLDQLNVQLPGSLSGAGSVNVVFTIDGQTSNPVIISIQ